MLAIQRNQEAGDVKVKANLLPCKIGYNGPVEADEMHWKPEKTTDGKMKAYFRGRELDGHAIKVPEGYKGSVMRVTGNVIPASIPASAQDNEEEDDETEQVPEETKAVEELGTFDEVMVWNHGVPWDASEDPYAKGIDEWMTFANAIHSQEDEAKPSGATTQCSERNA